MALTDKARKKFVVHTIPDGVYQLTKHVYDGTFELDPSGALLVVQANGNEVIWGPGVWVRIDPSSQDNTKTGE